MIRDQLAALSFILFLVGCAPTGGRLIATDDGSRPEVAAPGPIQVITDPGELRAARKLAATQDEANRREEAESLILIADSSPESFDRLRNARERVLPILRQRLANRAASGRWARAQAAFLLMRLEDPTGTAAARGLLADPTAADAVLNQLAMLPPAARATLPGVEPFILRALSAKDERVRGSAIGAAVRFGSEATDRKLLEVIRSGQDVRGQGAFGLARRAPTSELLQACTAQLRKAAPADRYWLLSAVAEHARSKDPEVAGPAIEVCAEFLGKSGGMQGMDGGSMAALEALEKTPSSRARALLTELIHAGGASDQVRGSALRSLARKDPQQGKKLALDALANPELARSAVMALGEAGRDSADSALVEALSQAAARASDLAGPVSQALLEIGGDPARKAAAALADQVPPTERAVVRWAEHGITPRNALERLVALKVVDPRTAAAARKRLAPTRPPVRSSESAGDIREVSFGGNEPDRSLSGIYFVEAAFDAGGLLTSFDTETGELPVRHDKLLLELAAHSGGAFKPEAAHERWERKGEEDEDAPYTVQFIHSGRLYRFPAQNLGDWYDVPAVLAAANKALADAGGSRRFITLEGDGQVANIAFVDPVAYAKAARELYLPAATDPDAARRDGKAFENQVVDQLRKGK